ncbi:hypothetical protein BDV19DRAFT_358806 [Aspergillus venezuelensis]
MERWLRYHYVRDCVYTILLQFLSLSSSLLTTRHDYTMDVSRISPMQNPIPALGGPLGVFFSSRGPGGAVPAAYQGIYRLSRLAVPWSRALGLGLLES